MVNGDDFTSLAKRERCDWSANELRKHFDLKERGVLGSGPTDDNIKRILKRILS